VANITFRPLNPRETAPVEQEAGWALDPVWTFWRREKSLAHAGIRCTDRPVRSIAAIPKVLFLDEYAGRPCKWVCVHVFFNLVLPPVTVNSPLDQGWPNSRSQSLLRPYRSVFTASLPSVALRLIFFGSTYICEEAFSQMKINQDNKAV